MVFDLTKSEHVGDVMLLIKAVSQGISEGSAIIIAAVVGTALGAVLQLLGAFAIDFLAGRREERHAKREDRVRREQWERDDELRHQEEDRAEARRREQQEREDKRREAEERAQVYKRFVAATTFAQPLSGPEQTKQFYELNEAFTDVQLYATGPTLTSARQLYEVAVNEVDMPQEGNTTEGLSAQRQDFWNLARQDLHEEPF